MSVIFLALKEEMMKKLLLTVMTALLLVLGGCSNTKEDAVSAMTLEDIMTALYDGFSEDELPMMGEATPVTDENVNWYLGLGAVDFKEGLAREAMISSVAHSVVLVRADEGQDVEGLKDEIKASIDLRKWICVGIEEDQLVVESRGDTILVVVVEDQTTRDKIVTNFNNL